LSWRSIQEDAREHYDFYICSQCGVTMMDEGEHYNFDKGEKALCSSCENNLKEELDNE